MAMIGGPAAGEGRATVWSGVADKGTSFDGRSTASGGTLQVVQDRAATRGRECGDTIAGEMPAGALAGEGDPAYIRGRRAARSDRGNISSGPYASPRELSLFRPVGWSIWRPPTL